jgi:hypothetical protein
MKKIKITLIGLAVYLVILALTYNNIEGTFLIPRFRPFGTSTTFTDSTNYVWLNKSFGCDTMRVRRDLYVGQLGGTIYLDTNKQFRIYGTALDMLIGNFKSKGGMQFLASQDATTPIQFIMSVGGGGVSILTMDTTAIKPLVPIQFNKASTGITTALFGMNDCPATVPTPNEWIQIKGTDGNISYIPTWR